MRSVIVIFVTLFIFLQYQLWFAAGGIMSVCHLSNDIHQQLLENKRLENRNALLATDVDDLKDSSEAIEERARNDLGMIRKGEVFYQVVK